MEIKKFKNIIKKGEHEKLDFKKEWYKDNDYNKKEIIKDLLGLINGNPNNIGETAYLIIGVKEGVDGSLSFYNCNIDKDLPTFKRELLQNINNFSNPKVTKLDVYSIKYEDKDILIIEVPQHRYLIELSKDLRPPNYRKYDTIYRIGDSTERASPDIIRFFDSEIELFKSGLTIVRDKDSNSEKEIKIDAHSILKLIISKRDLKGLSGNKGVEQNDGIFYKYYFYKDINNLKGFMFLGNKIINRKVFFHFFTLNEDYLPDKLEIFLTKQKKSDGTIVDKKRDIVKLCDQYSLNSDPDSIHYIDDFIWDNTILLDKLSVSTHKRQDFIDQLIYEDVLANKSKKLGLSLNYFKKEISNHKNPISVVTGSGGVGKTTFCDALQHTIEHDEDIKKQVFYIKGEKIVKYLSDNDNDKGIDSLSDLYDLYKNETAFKDLNETDFNLNYISGNIVVIVDAIEEIDSALNERFNLELFLDSLHKLNERFFSTKIILTTREHFLQKIEEVNFDKKLGIKYYHLYGFTQDNLNDFLVKRYKKDSKKISSVNNFIRSNNLFTREQYIIPLFVDWVCKIIDRPVGELNYESDYFVQNNRLDKLLTVLIEREIGKQSLNIDLDGMFRLLEEIIIHNNGSIHLDELKEYVELETNDEVTKYIKNPLLLLSNTTISINYDILHVFTKSRFLRHAFINQHTSSEKIISLLKECYQGKGELYLTLSDLLKDTLDKSTYIFYIEYLRKKYSSCERTFEKDSIRKSMSAILYLFFNDFRYKDKAGATKLLCELYQSSSHIDNLFIYGDFIPLDFSNICLMNSHFDGYSDFHKSKFPQNNEKLFLYCRFKNFDIPKCNYIKQEFFDSSCEFTKCNIIDIVSQSDKNQNKKLSKLYKDIENLTGYIGTDNKSLNLIKRFCSITFPKGEKKLLDNLMRIDYIQKIKRRGDVMYQINPVFYDDIPTIVLGTYPRVLKDKIENLV